VALASLSLTVSPHAEPYSLTPTRSYCYTLRRVRKCVPMTCFLAHTQHRCHAGRVSSRCSPPL